MAKVEETVTEVDNTDNIARVGAANVVEVIKGLNDPSSGFYSSIKGEDFAAKLTIASALTTSEPIEENLDTMLNLTNFIVTPVDFVGDDGIVETAPRVILIDDKGTAYHATSIGLLTALKNIVSVLGEPSSWPNPVAIKVVREKGNKGFHFFTIKF